MVKSLRQSTIVVVDTETTGLDPHKNAIVELGLAILYPHGEVVSAGFCWQMPSWAQLSDEVAQLPTFVAIDAEASHCGWTHSSLRSREIGEFLARHLTDLTTLRETVAEWAAYNAPFDLSFLRSFRQCERVLAGPFTDPAQDTLAALDTNRPWLDILPWARHDGGWESLSNKLSAACQRRDIEIGQAHRAKQDAHATATLLDALRRATFANSPITMADDWDDLLRQTRILDLQQQLEREQNSANGT